MVSSPTDAECTRDETGTSATIKCIKPAKDMVIFYRSDEMKYPQLIYAEDQNFPNEVAVSASFVPTFEPPPPQEEFEVLIDEEPELTSISKGKDFVFIFIVDRSGSMSLNIN